MLSTICCCGWCFRGVGGRSPWRVFAPAVSLSAVFTGCILLLDPRGAAAPGRGPHQCFPEGLL
ncbi:MAG: hypothetical protein QXO22_01720 [Thermosphaera sp.]